MTEQFALPETGTNGHQRETPEREKPTRRARTRPRGPGRPHRSLSPRPGAPPRPRPVIGDPWLRAQAINITRHMEALRPFRRDEFGSGAASPTEAHIQAVNQLMGALREDLLRVTRQVTAAAAAARRQPETPRLQALLRLKERGHDRVRAIEQVWDFYFELFGQRQSRFADWLLSCDRIALDCYQAAYRGLGATRSIPTPPAFSYMRTGFSPATFRRGIPLRRLGRQLNPFPLVQLPYHRLVNPWTLGAVLHEVSHNLQNDLGLARRVPLAIAQTLLDAGLGRFVAATWTRWNRELFADVSGLLLGGPEVVGSLLDVIGRSRSTVTTFTPTGPHPTPYFRALISIELLRRMGFGDHANGYQRLWARLYPDPRQSNLPPRLLDTFAEANRLVIEAVCFRPYPELGNRSLAEVMRFEDKDLGMIEEAARRLATGIDPGIIPERFLIGAARIALNRRLAEPGVIQDHFYRELARR